MNSTTGWPERALQLERELGREVGWDFDQQSITPNVEALPSARRGPEEAPVRDIQRAAATLAIVWRVPPATVLFILASESPAEAAWGRLVSSTWDRLTASQRAHLNALATEVEERPRAA